MKKRKGKLSSMELDFEKSGGLIPAIVQDWRTGEVLMLAYVSPESWAETQKSGLATYFSRSRGKLWKKGESSGNFQKIHHVFVDCDADTLLFQVEQVGGAACHTGHRSCFYREIQQGNLREISAPLFDPATKYGKKQ